MNSLSRLPQTEHLLQKGIVSGLHLGGQIYVSLDGDIVADAPFGEAAPGVPMTGDHLMLWLSAGKPVTAVLLAILREQGKLTFNDSLDQYYPAWEQNGQPQLTLRQLLTHTAGIPNVPLDWPEVRGDELLEQIAATPVVEIDAGYVVAASWFLLGEVVARVSGRSFSQAMRELLCEPLGLDSTWNGMSSETYELVVPRLAPIYESDRKAGLTDLHWTTAERVQSSSPGGNTRGPIRELGRFYEMLLSSGRGILTEDSITELTSRQREGLFDSTFQHRIDWGLGFIVNSKRYGVETLPYSFGRFASESSFGHGGAQSSMGFADPERKLVVAWAVNGRPGEPRHHQRNRAINEAIYEDLGIAGPL